MNHVGADLAIWTNSLNNWLVVIRKLLRRRDRNCVDQHQHRPPYILGRDHAATARTRARCADSRPEMNTSLKKRPSWSYIPANCVKSMLLQRSHGGRGHGEAATGQFAHEIVFRSLKVVCHRSNPTEPTVDSSSPSAPFRAPTPFSCTTGGAVETTKPCQPPGRAGLALRTVAFARRQ